MIPVEEALDRVLAGLAPTPAETVGLSEAWGRVLAQPVLARLTQPPMDVSAMDGYALRAEDAATGARLRVIGASPAGHPFPGTVGPGEAVRIFTGGAVPPGADTILLQEDATAEGTHVLPTETPRAGRHIRRAGLDFAAGDTVLFPGRRLTARDTGLAAAANHPWLAVHRRPRIGILATGDEISLPGDPIPPGGIVSSNAHALAGLVKAAGGDPLVLPIAADDRDAIAAAAEAGRRCDMLVTTGGASVGEHDLVQAALGPQGFSLDFWKIAMRPGKPLIFGNLRGTPLLGLPGNPVSALVCAVLFLIPAIRRLSGLPSGPVETRPALLGRDMPANDRRQDYVRGELTRDSAGQPVATPFPAQDSSMLRLLAQAGCLIIRPPHAPAAPAGSIVQVVELSSLGV
ncbi:molybdopterin molybdotransferase MoeA [Roseomonas sp. SSH11]|uniref:Molybdopterin molybdenumtransferase n=1 Tax=Pararoseomonas baculiformis TaxID=2820812 RepID=A0ABS4AFD5_9PROT|nr:gephyrin-like molybdotransferase Glp [Pararoseomonas baculiformis]MBP0445711.1 molybdopterin molybdotransferase MoeA [Pararoseomonas baculiformis]